MMPPGGRFEGGGGAGGEPMVVTPPLIVVVLTVRVALPVSVTMPVNWRDPPVPPVARVALPMRKAPSWNTPAVAGALTIGPVVMAAAVAAVLSWTTTSLPKFAG